MSYTIRKQRLSGVFTGLFLVAGLGAVIMGCDGGVSEITGNAPVESLDQIGYTDAVDQQLDALRFIDSYVDEAEDRMGKRLDVREMREVVMDANGAWLAKNGYSPGQIAAAKERLRPRLKIEASDTPDDQTIGQILRGHGLTGEQRRFIRLLIAGAEEATTPAALRLKLHRVLADARTRLGDKHAVPILNMAVVIEGFSRFLEEEIGNHGSVSVPPPISVQSTRLGKYGQCSARCRRGPKAWYLHFKWRHLTTEIITGASVGCAGGALLWEAIGRRGKLGCIAGGIGMGLVYGFFYKNDVNDAYRTNLRDWCDQCHLDQCAPRNDVGECRRTFGTDQYPPQIPEHHRRYLD